MFAIGLSLYFGGIAISVWRAWRVIARERLAALAVMLVLCAISGSWDAVWLLVAVDVVLLGGLILEHLRIETHNEQAAEQLESAETTSD